MVKLIYKPTPWSESMHIIGEKIMYGASGVMEIVDIREESLADACRSYYVLRPVSARTDSLTFVPTDNPMLAEAMRRLLTPDEILSLLGRNEPLPEIEWVKENRARQDRFKKIMESGDRPKMISMICAIDENGRRREAEGKKNFITDENMRAKAVKLLSGEIAAVMNLSDEDAVAMLENAVKS